MSKMSHCVTQRAPAVWTSAVRELTNKALGARKIETYRRSSVTETPQHKQAHPVTRETAVPGILRIGALHGVGVGTTGGNARRRFMPVIFPAKKKCL